MGMENGGRQSEETRRGLFAGPGRDDILRI